MLSEDEFGQALGVRMHAELADVEPAPGLAGRVRRQKARRALAVRVATSGVAAVAVVATIGVVHAGTATSPGGGTTSSAGAGTGDLRDVAYVQTQVLDALANSKNYILHLTWTDAGGLRVEELTDRSTGQARMDGFDRKGQSYSSSDSVPDAKGYVTYLYVYYHDRTWGKYAMRPGTPSKEILKFSQPAVELRDPAEVRKAIESGTLLLVGKEQKDGRATLHLRLKSTVDSGKGFPTKADIWVDEKSFLLYRITSNVNNKPTPDADLRYEWLPRTAVNLARLKVTPPSGFRKYTK